MGKTAPDAMKLYAIITGASQGLGKALAIECALRKIHLILSSLPGEQLAETALLISNTYKVEVLHYETDLADEKNCYLFYNWILQKQLQVYILINNAGIGSSGKFEELSPEFYNKQIVINNLSPVLLTRLLLPILQQQAAAYILNISSLANFFHIPGKEVYGATKSFLYSFSLSLRNSLANSTVSVSVACPGGIDTNERVKMANSSLKGLAAQSVQQPRDVATQVIRDMFRKKAVIIPGRLNRLTLWANRMIPNNIKNKIILKTSIRQSKSAPR